MENKLLIFNMKMYMDIFDVQNYLENINSFPDNVILCPEMIYLPYFLKRHNKISLQNIYSINKGAYTGEVSAMHAKKMGVNYAVIGHSERRIYFQESDTDVNAKIKAALSNDLKVILCIGESLTDYDNDNTKERLLSQIIVDLFDIKNINDNNLIIAYEPVWAIGTGKIPSNEEIYSIVSFIKSTIKDNFNIDVKVVYGGSVDKNNISSLNMIDNVDGFMVGGASTKVIEVNKIMEVVNN